MYGDGGSGKVPGSKMCIFKQDPSVNGGIGSRVTWIPSDVKEGPANDDIVTMGMEENFAANENGDFIFDFDEKPEAFDAAHTFAIVQQVLTIYRRALRRTKLSKSLGWQWGNTTPLRILPHAGDMMHAFYNREYKALAFFSFDDEEKGKTVYTCRSWDVVAHETGHAILDALKPKWYGSSNAQTGALHEAFGDITAIFLLLDQLDMCESIITQCKGDLHNHSMLAQIAEEFGSGLGRKFGLRNADHELTMKDVSEEIHGLSCVFTSAMYDILVGVYNASRDYNKYSPAETLFRAGKKLCTSLLLAIMASPEENATFKDVAEKFMEVEAKTPFKNIIRDEFKRRLVFDKDGKPKEHEGDIAANACGTMKAATSEELKEKLMEALKTYLPEPEEEKKPLEEEKKEEEQKANGDAATGKEEEAKEEEVKAEEAEQTKEAPKAEPEQMVNGNASPEEAQEKEKQEEKSEDKKIEEAATPKENEEATEEVTATKEGGEEKKAEDTAE